VNVVVIPGRRETVIPESQAAMGGIAGLRLAAHPLRVLAAYRGIQNMIWLNIPLGHIGHARLNIWN
jgi:hypothetical protein